MHKWPDNVANALLYTLACNQVNLYFDIVMLLQKDNITVLAPNLHIFTATTRGQLL